ncbi:hypothetical protein [Winogradskya humida]|uniref:Immunity protein 7 of polymorphic toxin system n=1 Tax=Winogradskya humida TaxID=113566 RepID=A0ABQ4A5I8_9ACTN|nr:hypothetical protein [Actinoplanes humidus]GIE26111.1 hypothetical protein Ahu01nite_092130 [Actinoplanes humidus]
MRFSLLYRGGTASTVDDVSDEELAALLAELDEGEVDAEHGDVWLAENISGWSVGVFGGHRGLVVLEDTGPGGGASHRTGVSRREAFVLLRRVADGDLDGVRGEVWTPGYGS